MHGISDDETIKDEIQQEIDESDQENEATDDDIDQIFEQDSSDVGGSGGFPDEMQEEEGD